MQARSEPKIEDAWATRFWMSRSQFERVVDVGAEVLELLDEVYVGPVVEDGGELPFKQKA